MKLLVAIGTVLLSALVSGNITGQHPASGTCLCLTGTNVRTHSSPGLHSTVLGSVSKPSCYKYHGGNPVTKDGYTWYQLQHVDGHNPWVAGTYLSVNAASHCSSTSGSTSGTACNDATAKDYACKLLHLADAKTIALWQQHVSKQHDHAYAYDTIRDACHGVASARSHYTCSECRSPGAPGGHVCLSGKLLHYIYSVYQHLGYIHVNEVSGACHTCHSLHYQGRAVDLHNPTTAQSNTMVSVCKSMGGNGWDEGNHVHCQF